MQKDEWIMKSADIVSAFVSRNEMSAEEVPAFLERINQTMLKLAEGDNVLKPTPPVPISESYTDEYIICLEDGKKVTLLKRYLAKHFDMTPEEYFEKWDLPEGYPIVTKAYSEKRSKIAKDQGLGRAKP